MNAKLRPVPHCPPLCLTFRAEPRYHAASTTMRTSVGMSSRHSVNARARVSLGGPLYAAASGAMP